MTSVTPNNPIICGDKGDTFDIVLPITEQLKANGTSSNGIVIYCHNQDVAKFYELFQRMLGPSFTDPPDFLNLSKYRLVDM